MNTHEQAAEMIFEAFNANRERPNTQTMLEALATGQAPIPGQFGKQEDTDADSR